MFNEPSEPLTYFNYYDILILIVLVCMFSFFTNDRIKVDRIIIRVIKVALVFLIIPILSMGIEIQLAVNKFGIDDSFTLLYTYLKIPIWCFLGVIVISYGSFINNRKK
ncbi:MAG: hypothetical protein Q4G18_04655 [Myroides sp.]|nr:hypothetical protein [Myroides sp.]